MWEFSDINDRTGFANGDRFESDDQVREYFTSENMREMVSDWDNAQLSQEHLDDMASTVIQMRWWMAETRISAAKWGTHGCPVEAVVLAGQFDHWEGVCSHPFCSQKDGDGPMWGNSILTAILDGIAQ